MMEVVGTPVEEKTKKHSPRTTTQINALFPVLDHYQYTRSDIAALIQRCHHDEIQIQIAVSNIIEDRANHETSSWGQVKSKKQMKEDKKLKEEEEAKESERIARELAKERQDAEKRAAREAKQGK